MARDLPEFQLSYYGNVSKNLVCYRAKSFLTKYITLQIDKVDSQFQILVAWMLTDRPPVYAAPGLPNSNPNQDGLSVSLSLFWEHNARPFKAKYLRPQEEFEKWAAAHPEVDLTNDDLTKAYYHVDIAMGKLIEHGIPYLDEQEKKYKNLSNIKN